ncbi:hypothetical protein ACX80W_00055 [Arthrobacter sp. TMN-37]
MITKSSAGWAAVLVLSAGVGIGISTLPEAQGFNGPGVGAESPSSAAHSIASASGLKPSHQEVDPGSRVHQPFTECSADYAAGPGADLDRNNMIGPENSVMLPPGQMEAMGLPEAAVEQQTKKWNELAQDEREEQLCRANQQNAVVNL